MNSEQKSFHLEEYKQLCILATLLQTRMENSFALAIAIFAGVFSWAATSLFGLSDDGLCTRILFRSDATLSLLWYLPAIAILFMGANAATSWKRINDVGEYMLQLEEALGSDRLGWIKFVVRKPWTITTATALLWIVLLSTALGAGHKLSSLAESRSQCTVQRPDR